MAPNAARKQLLKDVKDRLTGDMIVSKYSPGEDLSKASDGRNYKVKCFLDGHDDNTPSLSISISGFKYKCFGGCPSPEPEGDFIKLIMAKEHCDFNTALDTAAGMCGLYVEKGKVVKSKAVPKAKKSSKKDAKAERPEMDERLALTFHANLTKNKKLLKAFCDDRAVDIATVNRFRLGMDNYGNLTIPIYVKGKLVNIKYRNKDKVPANDMPKYWSFSIKGMVDGKKVIIHRYGEQRLFNIDLLDNPVCTAVVICGGEFDAIVATTLHPAIVGVASTTGEDSWDPMWANLFQEKDVFICLDNDKAGRIGTAKILEHIPDAKIIDLSPYVDTKGDVTEYVRENSTLDFKNLLQAAATSGRDGAEEFVIESVTDNKVLAVNPAFHITDKGKVFITGMFERDKVLEKKEGKNIIQIPYKSQEPMIITSDRELLEVPRIDPIIKAADPFAVATFNGWATKQEPNDAQRRWCGRDVMNYVKGGPLYSDAKQLFMDIYMAVKRYAHFTRKTYRGLVSTYIMGSYFYEGFASYPYLLLHGGKGSGKTTLAKCMAAMSFNSEFMISPTVAVMARKIEECKGLIVIDEAESLSKREQGRSPIGQILNSGYQRGASRSICNPDDGNKTVKFDLYCPKVICNIYGLNDVLKSRCIAISTQKVENLVLKIDDPEEDPRLKDISRRMYELLFAKAPAVIKAYHEVKDMDEFSPISSRMPSLKAFGRTRELFIPLFAMCRFVYNESGYSDPWDYMLRELHNISGEKDMDEDETPEEVLKEAVCALVDRTGHDHAEFTIHEINEEYKLVHLDFKRNLERWISKTIKKYNWSVKGEKVRRATFTCLVTREDGAIDRPSKKLGIYTFTRELLGMPPLDDYDPEQPTLFGMNSKREYLEVKGGPVPSAARAASKEAKANAKAKKEKKRPSLPF